jgi:hypothetical protein
VKKLLLVIVAILAVVIFYGSSGNFSAPKITKASEFVDKLDLGKSFYDMSFLAAHRTTTYRGMASKMGISEAEDLLEKHLRKSTKERQVAWNENLTKSYLKFYSESELVSIANELKKSPYAKKFENNRVKVGTYMRSISTELLKANLTEALKNAFTEFSNTDT